MIANYHTHTWRCNHASGTEEEYVRAALDAGIQILGFSDHTPYLFPDGYYSTFRMRPEQLAEYAGTIRELKKKHQNRIELHLGVECEYYPSHFRDVVSMLRDHQVEYMILGQHFMGNEYDSPYGGLATDREEDLKRYCRQSMEAMNTGLFTYFAHPDLIHFRGSDSVYSRNMRELFREAKRCGMPLEINLLGFREKKWYPSRRFLEAAAEEGCQMILGCDAHAASALNDPKTEAMARRLAGEYGLTILETVPLRSV